jgi:hypothetical protein
LGGGGGGGGGARPPPPRPLHSGRGQSPATQMRATSLLFLSVAVSLCAAACGSARHPLAAGSQARHRVVMSQAYPAASTSLRKAGQRPRAPRESVSGAHRRRRVAAAASPTGQGLGVSRERSGRPARTCSQASAAQAAGTPCSPPLGSAHRLTKRRTHRSGRYGLLGSRLPPPTNTGGSATQGLNGGPAAGPTAG